MKSLYSIFFILLVTAVSLYSQEEDIEDLLTEKVTVENPVYKPVIGLSTGVINFYGDVRNNYINPVIGNYGFKFNVASFLDARRYLRLNLFYLTGKTSGNQRSLTDPDMNLNFSTSLTNFGINFEYSFQHLLQKQSIIRPYLALGIETMQYSPKGDIYDANDLKYYYWTDGSLRNIQQSDPTSGLSYYLNRDYTFETDLRQWERDVHNLGNYSKSTVAIPVDLGISFIVSNRITCRIGSSIHFSFSDFIDNVSSTGTYVKGNKGNDRIMFNYISFDLDLFSDPNELYIEKMFAELDFDEVMLDDEDGDFILDPVDQCPGTPYGVVVDTLGCPIDTDRDGVPDYLDKDNFTPPGAWVDADGKTVNEEDYLKRLLARNDAMKREDVLAYFETIGKGFVRKRVTEIPDKFKSLDTDNDGYISFDELLSAIDAYFDKRLDLNVEDIYELNNFFFEQ